MILSLFDTKTSTSADPMLAPVVARPDKLDVVGLMFDRFRTHGLLQGLLAESARNLFVFDFAVFDP